MDNYIATRLDHNGHMPARKPKPARPGLPDLAISIRRRREALDLTQDEAAERLNEMFGLTSVKGSSFSRWERGIRAPGKEFMPRLAKLFGCSVAELHEPPRSHHVSRAVAVLSALKEAEQERAADAIEALFKPTGPHNEQ